VDIILSHFRALPSGVAVQWMVKYFNKAILVNIRLENLDKRGEKEFQFS